MGMMLDQEEMDELRGWIDQNADEVAIYADAIKARAHIKNARWGRIREHAEDVIREAMREAYRRGMRDAAPVDN